MIYSAQFSSFKMAWKGRVLNTKHKEDVPMSENMTPSENRITPGQIAKINEVLGAALRKSDFEIEHVQIVLTAPGNDLANELLAVVRRRVRLISNMIVRHVHVERDRSPQEMLDLTQRKQWIDRQEYVDHMPHGFSDEVMLCYFQLERWEHRSVNYVNSQDLKKAYERRNLTVDPYACIQDDINTINSVGGHMISC